MPEWRPASTETLQVQTAAPPASYHQRSPARARRANSLTPERSPWSVVNSSLCTIPSMCPSRSWARVRSACEIITSPWKAILLSLRRRPKSQGNTAKDTAPPSPLRRAFSLDQGGIGLGLSAFLAEVVSTRAHNGCRVADGQQCYAADFGRVSRLHLATIRLPETHRHRAQPSSFSARTLRSLCGVQK